MKPTLKLLPLITLAASIDANATDGYFAHGYGVKSQGMGGVALHCHKMHLLQRQILLAWV